MSKPGNPPSAARPAASDTPVGDAELASLFDALLGEAGHVILAVSGGADSVALMHLAARWRAQRLAGPDGLAGPVLSVATVDHGLRVDTAVEARWVAARAASLGLQHVTLTWHGEKPVTGVQDAARTARYRLLAGHARMLACGQPTAGPSVVAVAHHLDDQAETIMMRLARGSGLDGLAAMPARRAIGRGESVDIVRPLLALPKARLVATLTSAGLAWLTDPSNAQDRFERVRLRRNAPVLADAGIDNAALALSARRLMRARRALEAVASQLEAVAVDYHQGAYARVDGPSFEQAPEEVALRLLTRVVARLGGQSVPPPMRQMEALLARCAAAAGFTRSMAGCLVHRRLQGDIDVFREPGRRGLPLLDLRAGERAIWDNRFCVRTKLKSKKDLTVRTLSAGELARLRRTAANPLAMPWRAALTVPSLWRGDELLAVPHLVPQTGPRLFEVRFLGGVGSDGGAT